jgi:hypothetical protein
MKRFIGGIKWKFHGWKDNVLLFSHGADIIQIRGDAHFNNWYSASLNGGPEAVLEGNPDFTGCIQNVHWLTLGKPVPTSTTGGPALDREIERAERKDVSEERAKGLSQ